jgi:DNA invertase Pin-like site-specific DNA recombinase
MSANADASTTAHRRYRCAIYTRKSSEEGLEQSFNSLDAQREACTAFIESQKHEGWVAVQDLYDDGGLSGGSMHRPALQQLLEDIRSRRIDIVVVYKVDRLTRSLADFAKLTELFDAHEVSFVSVTQAFNTSTSMGRLTLNVLLSFAQFEREVAGERIRDKIALSKQRGMWMGGLPPLGYDGVDRQLVINEKEAHTVRLIYDSYLELGSIATLKRSVDQQGIVSKRRRYKDGKEAGGKPISRGALYQILRNRTYRGEIAHRGNVHCGNHEAIIDSGTWGRVQILLEGQCGKKRGSGSARSQPALLRGLVFDDHGHRLTPSHANKKGKRYRYYVSAPLIRGDKNARGIRIPAPDLERLVARSIADRLADASWVKPTLGQNLDVDQTRQLISAAEDISGRLTPADHDLVRSLITDIIVGKRLIKLQLGAQAITRALQMVDPHLTLISPASDPIAVTVEAGPIRCGKQVKLVLGKVETETGAPDTELITLVADAHRWFNDLKSGYRKTIAEIAKRENRALAHVSRTISLAFLAPDIVEMILKGQQPAILTPEHLKACRPVPLIWQEQRALLLD